MATAKKLPSGQWRVLAYIGTGPDGKRQYKSFTAGTKKEAEYMAAEYKLTEQRPSSPSKMTVGQLIDQYIDSKSNILSPTTISNYRVYRRCWMQKIMDIPVAKLTQKQLQDTVNEEASEHSAKSIKNIYGLITASLKAGGVRKEISVTLPKREKVYRELPTPEQVYNAVAGSDVELPVLLSMWLSLRMSEIKGIRRCDIVDGILTINQVKVNVDGVPTVKSAAKTYDSKRRLKVPQQILDLIPPMPQDEFLVQVHSNTVYTHFVRLIERAGLPKMRFHDLRHLNASVMVALGIPDKYAMERGGWSTPEVLKSVYQHTFSSERQQVDSAIDDYFSSIMQHKMQHEIKKPR